MVSIDDHAAKHAARIANPIACLHHCSREGLRGIHFLNENRLVLITNDEQFEVEIRTEIRNSKVARSAGPSPLTAVGVTGWAKGAVTFLYACTVNHDSRMVERIPRGIGDLSVESLAAGGERT